MNDHLLSDNVIPFHKSEVMTSVCVWASTILRHGAVMCHHAQVKLRMLVILLRVRIMANLHRLKCLIDISGLDIAGTMMRMAF